MNNENVFITKVVFTTPFELTVENVEARFHDSHEDSCCESHYLDWENLGNDIKEANRLVKIVESVDISGVPGDGILLRFYGNNKEFAIFVPGRGSNNGYYSSNLTLLVINDGVGIKLDIAEYQDY